MAMISYTNPNIFTPELKNRHSCRLPSQAWAQALAGIYVRAWIPD